MPHYITNEWSGKVIDVEDGALSGDQKGKKTQLYDKHGPIFLGSDGLNQLWYIIPSGLVDGKQTFRLLNAGYMNFLTARGSTEFSESLKGNDIDNGNEQKWFIAQDDNNRSSGGFYFITAGLLRGNPLANYNHSKDNNARLAILGFGTNTANHTNADFNFFLSDYTVSASSHPGITSGQAKHALIPKHAATKYLDLKGGGTADHTAVQLWDAFNNNPNQQWILPKHDIGAANRLFSIRSAVIAGNLKRHVMPLNNGQANGTPLVVKTSTSFPDNRREELWLILPVLREAGVYVVFSYNNSGKCMDVAGFGTANETPIQLWTFENNPNQKWSFKKLQ